MATSPGRRPDPMSAVTKSETRPAGTALADGFDVSRLPGAGNKAVIALRTAARDAFLATGLPGRRDEAWRYTSLSGLARESFAVPDGKAGTVDVAALEARVLEDVEDALRLAPGDCFGALDVITSRPEACAVKALTRASVYEIPKAAFEALMGERPELAMSLSKRLAQKSPAAAEHKDAPAAKAHGRTDLVHAIRAMFHTAQ